MVKKIGGIILMFLIGAFIAFFGVLLSLFADSTPDERYPFIALVIAAYFIVNFIAAAVWPELSWKWGLITGGPALVGLLLFWILNGFPVLILFYFLLVAAACFLGALAGARFGQSRRKKERR